MTYSKANPRWYGVLAGLLAGLIPGVLTGALLTGLEVGVFFASLAWLVSMSNLYDEPR